MGSNIFESLSKDELTHLEVFQNIFEEQVSKHEFDILTKSNKKYKSIDIYPKDLKQIDGTNPNANELDALKIGIDSEIAAIEFYEKIKNSSIKNDVKDLINIIIEQEKNHYQILQNEFNHLSTTGYWYELDYLGG
jgi:rubrerythrin